MHFLVRLLRFRCRRAPMLSPCDVSRETFVVSRAAPPRFLIPAYTGLGNFIMMTPLFRVLRETWPQAEIHLVAGNPWGAEFVLEGSGWVDQTWILPEDASWGHKLIFFWRLRREKIGVAFIPFDASPAFYWLGTLLAGIPVRVGHTFDILKKDMSWTRAVLTHEVSLRFRTHESDLHLDLLDALLPQPCRRTDRTHVQAAATEATLEKFGLIHHSYVALQVSAANAMATPKRWPLEKFLDLAARLHGENRAIVLLGDARDRALVDDFVARTRVPLRNLVGQTTIAEVAAILKGASVLVCHDSGLMHIGNAVGVPLVALYGPTDLDYTRPRAPTSRVIRNARLSCIGCMKDFGKTEAEALRDCRREVECMRSITPEEVMEAVKEAVSGEQ